MQEVILVKLGEIVLKGLNRRTFEDRLLKNIRRRIARAGNFEVYSMQSTIYIEPKDEDADIDEAEERISKIFGVIGYARACVCEKDMDAITKMAPEYLNDTLAGFKTFKFLLAHGQETDVLGKHDLTKEGGKSWAVPADHVELIVLHGVDHGVEGDVGDGAAPFLDLLVVYAVFSQRPAGEHVVRGTSGGRTEAHGQFLLRNVFKASDGSVIPHEEQQTTVVVDLEEGAKV